MSTFTQSLIPKQISVVVGPFVMGGWADNSICKLEYEAEEWNIYKGISGEIARCQNHDKSARLTLSFPITSPSNIDLASLAFTDNMTAAGTFPVVIRDSLGNIIYGASACWIQKRPNISYEKEVPTIEWQLFLSDADFVPAPKIL